MYVSPQFYPASKLSIWVSCEIYLGASGERPQEHWGGGELGRALPSSPHPNPLTAARHLHPK